jgi:chromosome segregation ATPase
MDFTSTADILAQAHRFGDELKLLDERLDIPRTDLLRHVAALQAGFAALLSQISAGLETRDTMLLRIEEAAEDLRKLSGQVKAMDAEIRALRARVDHEDGRADPFAGRH